jgi:hypothetical protein
MSRWLLCAASLTMLAGGWGSGAAGGQSDDPLELPSSQANPLLTAPSPPLLAEVTDDSQSEPAPQVDPTMTPVPSVTLPPPPVVGYVQLKAPLYPAPQPNIPIWTGGTMITNQAFAPHEMLYPHTYRAVYPPFYHRVKGQYFWTPFGYRTNERWDLLGTEVKVKYRSHWPIFGPHPPAIKYWGRPWY